MATFILLSFFSIFATSLLSAAPANNKLINCFVKGRDLDGLLKDLAFWVDKNK